ncbi:MAG TPA: glycosyltransferase family 4 protein [Candidatus Sumerlaeota bacterium]|nr:glycosyltransferase family 4 protein [Candidatus Sumerlaeota bacterium]
MRVLWFTTIPMPAVDQRLGLGLVGSGGWMSQLLEELKARGQVRLAVATAANGLPDLEFESDGVTYFTLHEGSPLRPLHREEELRKCAALVERWRPDLIHVHGLERFFGLLESRRLVTAPVVISIQGILAEVFRNLFGRLSFWDVARMERLRDIVRGRGWGWTWWRYRQMALRETEIVRGARVFMGRTEFDRRFLLGLNPAARYYHVDELLRRPFHDVRWNLETCERYRILFANASHPHRDIDTALEAVALLKGWFPDVRLCLPGAIEETGGYGKHLSRRISRLRLQGQVEFLGFLSAERMAAELTRAHVFATSSRVENSSNSLCEAMRVGVPCVASRVGGLPSLAEEGRSALFFPPTDAGAMAERIARIFRENDLACSLGDAARERAVERHDPDRVVAQLMTAYEEILSPAKKGLEPKG